MADNPWVGVRDLIAQIKKCEEAGAWVAAVAMAYVCIDTMAFLAMPQGQSSQTRKDFIDWTDMYLKAHPSQPYQYAGIDVYAARCATLHAFGSEADLHRKDKSIRQFGYTDGGQHHFDPQASSNVVIIGLASFVNDVVFAVHSFLAKCRSDVALRTRVESRLDVIFNVLPHPQHVDDLAGP